jgi:flagellar hook protein FlgE
MALTSAFFTGLSGLDANATGIDVIGNNIANVNTPAFKSSRALFTTQFLQNLSQGSPPTGESGGTNPVQVGLGTRVAGIQMDFSNGGIQATGVSTHMAIEGNGFFVVESGNERYYTRDGQFGINSRNDLTTASGAIVQGYGVDPNFNIQPSVLQDINIPIGSMTIAEASSNAVFEGNLNAAGDVSTGGSIHNSRAFYTDVGLTTLATGAEDLTSPLTQLYTSDGSGGSTLAFDGGNDTIITVNGVEKAGQAIATKSFAFSTTPAVTSTTDSSGTTLADFASFLDEVFGLDASMIGGESLGGSVAFTGGQFVVTGNEGTVQSMKIETGDFVASNVGAASAQPLVMSKTQDADGESARTTFVVYDSLGTPISVDLTFVKQGVIAGGGTVWEFVAESSDTSVNDRVVGLGVVEFDANGNFLSSTNDSIQIARDNGATTPLTVTINFDSGSEAITALADTASVIASIRQDGSPIGTLDSFSVGENGIITGSFTNGSNRTIGQVALSTFINNEGLVEAGAGLYSTGPNSGDPVIVSPQQLGAGRILSGALEQSNVDLAEEFVKLITASTGFSASSRVISTSDELIQQLLITGR